MTDIDALIKSLDSSYFELGEAFADFPDIDLWTRPHPKLLSVGELAAHIAYGEGSSFFESGVDSPLNVRDARYYPHTVGTPVVLSMSAAEVLEEVNRVHEVCKAAFLADPKPYDALNPLRGDWSWGYTLEYAAFHVAYHTGQIYSVRHLLDHETADN
ncbi:MAG: DinB family protein [Fimbriimonadaceae bacterium]|nr:DinB family protein [Fimbriimonadaceae bacterium]